MASNRDEGPVYYREIQKNAYLTRIPNEVSGGKLRPLGSKKAPNKPMWTQFCVHNGRTPYLEQYPAAESGSALAHRPVWRACLRGARHVTASVKPRRGDQFDFLVDTDSGAVRMLAPDWESMQDWVSTLRNTLHELKIVSRGENVYCAGPAPPPAPPAPRAAARDPTSPLPPTPPTPPDRVPGIELTPNVRTTQPQETTTRQQETTAQPQETTHTEPEPAQTTPHDENIDISNWEPFASLPSTSQSNKSERKKSVAKICGQNICLDDSLFKRSSDGNDSDDEFFADIDKESIADFERNGYKQRMVVSDEKSGSASAGSLSNQATNITVIQVSNKEPPHTAIPILGPETDVFDFDFKQNLTINDTANPSFVNIVNTEHNDYGTTFSNDSDYGHLSLTTTVNLTGPIDPTVSVSGSNPSATNEDLYERLCLASTSNIKPPPKAVKKVKHLDKSRKSSLPNLDDSTYEYLFLSNNNSNLANNSGNSVNNSSNPSSLVNLGSNSGSLANNPSNLATSASSTISSSSPINSRNLSNNSRHLANNPNNLSNNSSNLANSPRNVSNNLSNLSNNSSNLANSPRNLSNNSSNLSNNTRNLASNLVNNTSIVANEVNSNGDNNRVQISSTAIDPISRVTSVERSRSQNAYDAAARVRERENLNRRVQDNSPKRDTKNDKTDQPHPKPIWRRGLTELSILTRIRSIGQLKRPESPTRNDEIQDRIPAVSSPVKIVHRARPEVRVDSTRRRSSSLSNGSPAGAGAGAGAAAGPLQPLRARQAAELRAEQRRGAALVAAVPAAPPPPLFADYNKQVWVSRWGGGGSRWGGRCGDRVCAVRGVQPKDAAHAAQLLQAVRGPVVDILFHRVPLGNIYVLNKREHDSLGIKLDGECNITQVESDSAAGRAGLPPPGKWAVTEVNNRPVNILKGGEEDMNRLSMHGSEVSILIQPSPLVKKLRAALKANKTLLGLR